MSDAKKANGWTPKQPMVSIKDLHKPFGDLEVRKKVGMVFQQYNLFPHKTALENIMMALITVLKQDKDEVA